MANTTNLNMVKPAGTDHALISVINSNMDIIDGAVGALPSGTTLQGEIDSANQAIGNITNYVDLGNMASQSALETALDTKLSSMGEFSNVTIRFLVTSSFAGFAANTYVGTLSKGGASGSYAAALLESIIGTSKAIVKATKNTSWRFEELATSKEKLPAGNNDAVDVSTCSTLGALFDAIDGHSSPVGVCGTGNQQTSNAKTLLGGSGISNYDECVIYRLSYNQYIAIASSDVLSGACKIKILSRAGNARTDVSRMSQTAWLTLPT